MGSANNVTGIIKKFEAQFEASKAGLLDAGCARACKSERGPPALHPGLFVALAYLSSRPGKVLPKGVMYCSVSMEFFHLSSVLESRAYAGIEGENQPAPVTNRAYEMLLCQLSSGAIGLGGEIGRAHV
jgi:hypothetical protein